MNALRPRCLPRLPHARCPLRPAASTTPSLRPYSSPPRDGGPAQGSDADDDTQRLVAAQIASIVKDNAVVLFMKGKPDAPQCGFSRLAAHTLSQYSVNVATVNVLDSEPVREAVKRYTSWPTIPQVFVRGEFIGGADILAQMHQSGELRSLFERAGLLKDGPA